jgi:hypothetical protein
MSDIARAVTALARVVTEGSTDSARTLRTVLILAAMTASVVIASLSVAWVLGKLCIDQL